MIGFLQGPTGESSSSRMVMAVVVIGIVFVWGASSLISAFKGTPQIQVPWEIVSLGMVSIVGKVGNSVFAENKPQ